MSSLRLRPALGEDVPAMAALDVSVFLGSPMHKAMFPDHLRTKPGVQDQVEWNTARMRKGLADPNLHFLVVLAAKPEGGDIVVGCAEWSASATDAGLDGKEKSAKETMELRVARLPPFLDRGALLDASHEITELLERPSEAFKGNNRHKMWTLNSLSVDEDYRGRGIGKMLARWGLDRADEDKAHTWVIASPLGRPLYQTLGFKQVTEGSRCGEPRYVMLRLYEPRGGP